MIFKILQFHKMAREAKENPGKFAGGKVGEYFVGSLIVPSLVLFLILVIFFVLGFTHLLGGPYWFFQFLFVLSFLSILGLIYILRKIYKFIMSVTNNVVSSVLKVDSKVVE